MPDGNKSASIAFLSSPVNSISIPRWMRSFILIPYDCDVQSYLRSKLLGLIIFAPWAGPGYPQIRPGRTGIEPLGPPIKRCLKTALNKNRRRKP